MSKKIRTSRDGTEWDVGERQRSKESIQYNACKRRDVPRKVITLMLVGDLWMEQRLRTVSGAGEGRISLPNPLPLTVRRGQHTLHHTLIRVCPIVSGFSYTPPSPSLGQLINAFSMHPLGRQVGRQAGSQEILVVIKLSLRGPFY